MYMFHQHEEVNTHVLAASLAVTLPKAIQL